MDIHIDDRFMIVSEDSGVISLRWKKETEKLTDDLFKQQAYTFIDVIKKTKIKKIMVDMRDFQYSLSSAIIARRNEYIIGVYNEIGVTKFAFISDTPTVPQDDPANTFVTKIFVIEKEAMDWFSV